MPKIRRMLVPTDFSQLSDIAFIYAVDLAADQGSQIRLLHVVDEGNFATAYPDGFFVELPNVRATLLEEAGARLEPMVERCKAAGVKASLQVLVGRPARIISELAVSQGIDLIVMGTHGRSGVAHLMVGSVTERVVRTAPCPVLTVRDTAHVADALHANAAVGRVEEQPAV
jgi:nucleotide-binding universal stress UspA family protein